MWMFLDFNGCKRFTNIISNIYLNYGNKSCTDNIKRGWKSFVNIASTRKKIFMFILIICIKF